MHLLDIGWALLALIAGTYPLFKLSRQFQEQGVRDLFVMAFAFTIYPSAIAGFHLTPFDKGLVDATFVFVIPAYLTIMLRFLGHSDESFAPVRRIAFAIAGVLACMALSNPWLGYFAVFEPHTPGVAHHLMTYETPLMGAKLVMGYGILVIVGTACATFWKIAQTRVKPMQLIFGVFLPIVGSLSPLFAENWVVLPFNGILLITTATLCFLTYWLLRYESLHTLPISHSQIISVIPDPVVIIDGQNSVVDCNLAFIELCNQHESKVIGAPLRIALPNSELLLEAEADAGGVEHVEYSCKQKNKVRHFDVIVKFLSVAQNPNGARQDPAKDPELGKKLLLLRDITEHSVAMLELKYSQQQLNAANIELERLSNTDALTGLYNRRFFQDRLESELSRMARHGGCLGLLAIDVDHFKSVNDEYGHVVGDSALIHISRILEMECRASDVLARTGGEEFVILLAEADEEQLLFAADRFRQSVATTPIPIKNADVELNLSLSISVGATIVAPGDTIREILSRVDKLLYAAKAQGRNRYVVDIPTSEVVD